MKLIMKMLLRLTWNAFLGAVFLFAFFVEIADLFSSIVDYIQQETPWQDILRVQVAFLPKAISYALPIGMLFSVSYAMGNLYQKNELIAILSAGVSLQRLLFPIFVLAAAVSVGGFFFEDLVVVDSLRERNRLSQELLGYNPSLSNSDVAIADRAGDVLYFAAYYNDDRKALNEVSVFERGADGGLLRRVDAERAVWEGTGWLFERAFVYGAEVGTVVDRLAYRDPQFNLDPEAFRRTTREIDEMRVSEARVFVETLRDAGLPYRRRMTDYYERYSFALTPLVVTIISGAVGGRLKRNIVLMSLLISLVVAVVYYVTQMVMGLLATEGIIDPIVGAWGGVLVFFLLGLILLRRSRT